MKQKSFYPHPILEKDSSHFCGFKMVSKSSFLFNTDNICNLTHISRYMQQKFFWCIKIPFVL